MTDEQLFRAQAKATKADLDRYQDALYKARDAINQLVFDLERHVKVPTIGELRLIAGNLDRVFRSRQHICPQCGEFVNYSFAFADPGPNIEFWDCPKCGRVKRKYSIQPTITTNNDY